MRNYHRNYGRIANGKTTVEAAWQLCLTRPEIREDFDGQTKIYGWGDVKFDHYSPFWAYWFARNVVTDEWLPGEDVILKDEKVWKTYCQYIESMRACGCVGHTLREDPDFVVDECGVIKGWKPGRGPVLGEGKRAKRTTLAERFGTTDAGAIADRIAQQMKDFKTQKKLRDASQEDDTDED
jgi:hypothetical protein